MSIDVTATDGGNGNEPSCWRLENAGGLWIWKSFGMKICASDDDGLLARSKVCRCKKSRGIFHFKNLTLDVSVRLVIMWTRKKPYIPLVDAKMLGRRGYLGWFSIFPVLVANWRKPFAIFLASL
jgi:hypothetical protein